MNQNQNRGRSMTIHEWQEVKPVADADTSDYNMSHPLDFIGQRADQEIVQSVEGVEDVRREDGIVTTGVVKEVEYYTMTCDDCGGDGYYDQLGEVICEDCGMVISGDSSAVVSTEFGETDDAVGNSRGLEKMDDTQYTRKPGI